VLVHVFDVLQQALRFRANEHALPIAIEKFDCEQRLQTPYPTAHGGVVEPKLPRRGMHAAMPGNFQKYPQVVPLGGAAAGLLDRHVHAESVTRNGH
jgi:hypothetical protein